MRHPPTHPVEISHILTAGKSSKTLSPKQLLSTTMWSYQRWNLFWDFLVWNEHPSLAFWLQNHFHFFPSLFSEVRDDQPEQRQSLPGLFCISKPDIKQQLAFPFLLCSPSFLPPPSKYCSITKGEHLEMDACVWITILINLTSAGRNGGLKQKAEHFTATGGSNQERQHWELCPTAHNHIKWAHSFRGKHVENKHEMVRSSLAPRCVLFFSLFCIILLSFTFCMLCVGFFPQSFDYLYKDIRSDLK